MTKLSRRGELSALYLLIRGELEGAPLTDHPPELLARKAEELLGRPYSSSNLQQIHDHLVEELELPDAST